MAAGSKGSVGDGATGRLRSRPGSKDGTVARGVYEVRCYEGIRGEDGVVRGALKWSERVRNLVTDEGCNHILSIVLDGGTQITTWYVGLKDTGNPAAGDTMSSHSGWTEFTSYDETTRRTWTGGTVAAKSVDNSASPATFTINATGTVGGCFLTSNNTKSGTTGTLYSAVNFTQSRSVVDNDVLDVIYTFTLADDGV